MISRSKEKILASHLITAVDKKVKVNKGVCTGVRVCVFMYVCVCVCVDQWFSSLILTVWPLDQPRQHHLTAC